MKSILQVLFILILTLSCQSTGTSGQISDGKITPAADRPSLYLPLLQGKKVGLIVNQTSTIGQTHLVDYLRKRDISISTIFTPEHGFRGEADAGEKIEDGKDPKSGIKINSLYGKNKKPSATDLAGLDILLFDIQDVGVRFYTYISTLHYVMEAAAENNLPVIVLDRPNPLGCYIDGPVLEPEYKSFVGMHPVPVVYGMTIGEYAQMINGEGWLEGKLEANLTVIPLLNYNHLSKYILPIKPSPNLPNNIAIGHYPSLCFFEGTTVSVGRGTAAPFQQIGHPAYSGSYSFKPTSGPGSKYPKHENVVCQGIDLQKKAPNFERLDFSYIIEFYEKLKNKEKFFNDDNFFNLLAGTDQLKKMIVEGVSEDEIRANWAAGLLEFEMTRKKYLLYE